MTTSNQEACRTRKCRGGRCACYCLTFFLLLNLFALMHTAHEMCKLFHLFGIEEVNDAQDTRIFFPGGNSAFCNDICVDVCITDEVGCDIVNCLNSCKFSLNGGSELVEIDEVIIIDYGYYNDDADSTGNQYVYDSDYYYDQYFGYFHYADSDYDYDSEYYLNYMDDYYKNYYDTYDSDSLYASDVYSTYVADGLSTDNVMVLSATQMKIASMYNELLDLQIVMSNVDDDDEQYIGLSVEFDTLKDETWIWIEAYNGMATGFEVDISVSDWLDYTPIFGADGSDMITSGSSSSDSSSSD